ncbi:MAG: TetR family transcriptional regulator [Acidimicrobiia bacterium]|nr:TetR family transcriptional regulator [Acidimicrobiia bacterium]
MASDPSDTPGATEGRGTPAGDGEPGEPGDTGGAPGGRRRSFIEQARRAQIVQAAIATIAEVGYAKASFARIAERAGISPGLISYHFAGKDELMSQIVAEIDAAMEQAITAETEHLESYGAALRAMIEAQVRYFGAHVSEMIALGQIFSDVRDGEGVPNMARSMRRKTLAELEEMFREGQQYGHFGDFAARPMAVTMLAALESVPAELIARPGTDVDAYARDLATIFELATRPPPPGGAP